MSTRMIKPDPDQKLIRSVFTPEKSLLLRNWIPIPPIGRHATRPPGLIQEMFLIVALFILLCALFVIFSLYAPGRHKAPTFWITGANAATGAP